MLGRVDCVSLDESGLWLLVSDVDDTLCGDHDLLEEFSRWSGFRLIVNSSRPRGSVLKTLAAVPPDLKIDGVITALGTEILLDGREVREWSDRFADWDRGIIDELMAAEGFFPHPGEFQARFKASFTVPVNSWETMMDKVCKALPGSRIIASGDSDFDVIPSGAGKDNATLFVAELLGIRRDRLIVAGDSGNDFDMFEAVEKAIAVGNARRELLERANPDRTCFAREPRAAGLLEGLQFWGVPVTRRE